MLKLNFLFFSLFLVFKVNGQSLAWLSKAKVFLDTNNHFAKHKDMAIGPDQRIYTTGYFTGDSAQMGSMVLSRKAMPGSFNPSASGFFACFDTNGNSI
jgi:hypothetical protein